MFAQNISILFEWLVFLGTAFVALLAAVLMVTRKNPIHSAIFLILTLLCTAVLFFLLQSPFIAIIQVLVYAGAIMMLIVFVVMLLELEEELRLPLKISFSKGVGVLTVLLIMLGLFFAVFGGARGLSDGYTPELLSHLGSVRIVGKLLFTDYLLPFEIVSVLLMAAIVGAVALTKKRPSEKE
ncbi:MAG: NADH-quinone oxidoreductase subunit J [Deltaproteobacteria bacterium]|nr:NADH-quinone oxidoreductase subunit J [Deltaproteobacteria bacterium]MBW2120341.1 NADH-quinone oxidoreductase subunit J [Deltaproteobacteria bacterium]